MPGGTLTAQVTAIGGRDGRAMSSDGVLDVPLTTSRARGGAGRWGTNPEQLFAAGVYKHFKRMAGLGSGREMTAMRYWVTDGMGNRVFEHQDTITSAFLREHVCPIGRTACAPVRVEASRSAC